MKFFQLIPTHTNFDFIGKFPIFLGLSVALLIAVVAGIFTKGFNFGIDFTGGTVAQVQFAQPTAPDAVRQLMADVGEADASVVSAGPDQRDYLITVRAHKNPGEVTLDKKIIGKAGAGAVKIQSLETVGPKVGQELKMAAIQSLFYSVILIMIYIWFRFDYRFAPGATIAMIHDLLMVAGFYLLTGKEFTITAVAALLTIAGYSVNDTIVIYDRVREMNKKSGDSIPLPKVLNDAINVTLSRTVLTGFVTLLSVIPIIFLCKGDIRDFAQAMAIGIFVGCYSTMYIAAPLTIYVEKYFEKKKGPARSRPAVV